MNDPVFLNKSTTVDKPNIHVNTNYCEEIKKQREEIINHLTRLEDDHLQEVEFVAILSGN